jgi:hypothetical protein
LWDSRVADAANSAAAPQGDTTGGEAAMMSPFFRTPLPAEEEERKFTRAIAWLALGLWAVIVLLAAVSLRRPPSRKTQRVE